MTQRDMSAYALGAAFEYRTDTFSFRTGANAMAPTCARGAGSARQGDDSRRSAPPRRMPALAAKPAYPQPKAAITACIFLTPVSAVRLD